MTQFMIIGIILYLAWLTYYILYAEPAARQKDAHGVKPEAAGDDNRQKAEPVSVIGRSKFRMSVTVDAGVTKRATEATKDDTAEEAEELLAEDVTFAPENETRRPARLSPDEMQEAFEDIRIEDVTGDDDTTYGEPSDDMASGATYEDIDLAVRVAKGKEATQEEKARAAVVLTELQGTQLYERLTDGKDDIRMRIKLLIDLQMEGKAQPSAASGRTKDREVSVPDNLDQFHIRDYV